MGVTVNGGNTGFSAGNAGGALGVTAGSAADRMRAARENRNKKPRKKLNYNPREISGQLVRAKKSGNASVVLIRAKGKLSVLYKAYASGQYNRNEVQTAIAHARRMVECSRLKVRNLKEEELLKGRNERDERNGEQKKKNEVRRRVKKREQDARVKMAIEESQRVLKEKTKRQILLQKRRMHRNEERGKINEADIKYLEDQLKNNQNESADGYTAATLDLSMEAAQMADLQMIEQQIWQQVELEVEMECIAMDAAGMPSAAALSGAIAQGGGEAPAVTINLTV